MVICVRLAVAVADVISAKMNIDNMKKAFTLIELLVVIAIISVLTVITVSQFQTARKKANDVQRKADLSSLSKALLMYYTDYERFPASTAGEIQLNGGAVGWGLEFNDNGYVYMKVVPEEKKADYPQFCYVATLDQKKFALYAMLENKADSDCTMNGNDGAYLCNGERYCFTIFSPNSQKGEVQN